VRGGVLCIAAVAVLLLAACGGGSSTRLTEAQYRAKMTKIEQEAADAASNLALGLQAKSVAELQHRIDAFSAATQRIGDEVAKVKPPQNAEAANTQLAQGMHETARATHVQSGKIAQLHTAQEAIAYLESTAGNQKGAHEVNDAFAKLRKLGYVRSS